VTAGPRRTSFRDAIRDGIAEEMSRDPRVLLIGEDVGPAGGVFQQTQGLFDRFGPARVIDTPISEAGFVGVAIGAAMAGMRPIVEVMFGDFLTLGLDQIVNQAAKVHWMSDGQFRVPMVIRAAVGVGGATGPQHSQSFHAWVSHVPGLKVVYPADPGDAKALFKTAIRDDNPVIFFEDRMSYGTMGPVGGSDGVARIGEAAVRRPGQDIALFGIGRMTALALQAAERLEVEGISAEVVDVRSLRPLDVDGLEASLRRTHRALVLDPAPRGYGAGAEIAASLQEVAFDWLDAPVGRLGMPEAPVPFAPALERQVLPDAARIAAAARELVGR
jgi:pyruvate/2-oxoglutarate/acetoin dehydrogenase E1 component